MSSKANILIIEDEPAIRTGLVDVLIFHGYSTDFAEDGNTGLEKALSGKFDLILLDVMLTAKTSDEDIIQGLQLGADDYVAKPFSIAQLILRIQAVLRRSGVTQEIDHLIELGSSNKKNHIKIDTRNLSAIKNKHEIHFTKREMDILLYLYNNAERPVPRDELLNKLWGYAKNIDLETRTVDIHIAKLRRKIEHDPSKPIHLETVRGAGYKLNVK